MTRRLGLILLLWAMFAGSALAQFGGAAGGQSGAGARAQAAGVLVSLGAQLRQLGRDVAAAHDDAALSDLRGAALALQAKADGVAQDEARRVAALDGDLAQLGPPPPAGVAEAASVREARAGLQRARTANDGLARQAKLLSTAAGQSAEHIAEQRRLLFNRRLFTRAASPLSPDFWSSIDDNLPRDLARLRRAGAEAAATAERRADARNLALLLSAVVAAVLLIGPARSRLERLGRRRLRETAPSGDLGRSGLAVWRTAVGTLLPALGAGALRLGLGWSRLASPQASEVADTALVLVVWIGFVTALGRAFLAADLSAWRLPPLSDRLARRLRPYPWVVAAATAGGGLLERVNSVLGASLAATVAANCAISLAYAAAAALGLLVIGRARISELDARAGAPVEGSPLRSLLTVATGLAIAVTVAAALLGYFALAYLVARELVWVGIIACLLYLLLQFIDDAFTALFSADSRTGRQLRAALALKSSTLEQFGVVGSALARVAVLLVAIGVVLAPFGAGAGAVLGRFGSVATGFKLGGLTLSPLGLATGVLSFLIGLWIVRAIQRWLNTRYLPRTEWDTGVRASVSTAVGYLGVVAAAAWAAASMGLALQQIALIASALSVGIGFGLQAIVSNFISGLILLVERPVQVGDWVSLGELEGDVRRINVRATEITMFDRSTLIVPNSEFVTKTVRNVTLGDAVGRITVRLTLDLSADVEGARDIFLQAYKAHPAVLTDPAPSVFIDAVTDSGVVMQSFSYVSGPRAVYPTRSALLFDILGRLRAAKIPLAQSRTNVQVDLSAPRGPEAASRDEMSQPPSTGD